MKKVKELGKSLRGLLGYEEHNFVHVVRVADATTSFIELLNEDIKYFDDCEKYSSKTYSNGKALNKITLKMLETQLVRSQHASNSAVTVKTKQRNFWRIC